MPRHKLVLKIEDKVIHMTVEETVSIAAIYTQIAKYLGYDVTLHQTIGKDTWTLYPNEFAKDGMHFAYNVHVKRVVPLAEGERTKDGDWTLHVIPGVLRAEGSTAADESGGASGGGGGASGGKASGGKKKRERAEKEESEGIRI